MSIAHILVASCLASIDPECQTLVDANSQAVGLIREMSVHYVVELTADDGSRKRVDEVWWTRDGQRERIRRVTNALGEPTADGRPRGISDVVIDGGEYKWLQNWDPEKPQKITPTHQGTLRASVAPHTNSNPAALAPSQQLLLEVHFMPRRTLSELARVSPHVTCKGKVTLDGRDMYLISLESPEITTPTTTKWFFDVYLDPSANYMIRRVKMSAPKIMFSNGKVGAGDFLQEVTEFKDLGDGIFAPAKVRFGRQGKWVSELTVESLSVNTPLAPDAFEMKWPKYAAVHYYPPTNGKVRFHIWGDGKPIREFNEPTQLQKFEDELLKDPAYAADLVQTLDPRLEQPISTMAKLSIILGILVVIVIGLILYRRIREQNAT